MGQQGGRKVRPECDQVCSTYKSIKMPFNYTAVLLYAAANIAEENPVADKTKHGILATALGDCAT